MPGLQPKRGINRQTLMKEEVSTKKLVSTDFDQIWWENHFVQIQGGLADFAIQLAGGKVTAIVQSTGDSVHFS